METNVKAAEVTPEMIEGWKKQYGSVFELKVEDKIAFLRTPDRKTMSYAATVVSNNPIKFNEILLNGCWLAGDEEIRTSDAYFLSVMSKMADLFEVKESTLVKL